MSPPVGKGSLVLVTGANGYIGSHVVDQLLGQGMKVRGTVRSQEKGKWAQDHFDEKYGKGKLELVIVSDFSKPGAYNEAVKGVHGIAHVAGDVSFSSNPDDVIPGVINSVHSILEAASKEKTVTRFVITSSSTAATNPKPNEKFTIDENSWNEEAIADAKKEPNAWNVYSASKTRGEQEVWKFAKEHNPHFSISSVLPNANFGTLLHPSQRQSSTPSWITGIYNQSELPAELASIPPQYMVNVVDSARLHVVALLDPEVEQERLFAFDEPYTWKSIIETVRKLKPEVTFPDNVDKAVQGEDQSKVARRDRADALLKKHFGSGFAGLEETLKQQLACY